MRVRASADGNWSRAPSAKCDAPKGLRREWTRAYQDAYAEREAGTMRRWTRVFRGTWLAEALALCCDGIAVTKSHNSAIYLYYSKPDRSQPCNE